MVAGIASAATLTFVTTGVIALYSFLRVRRAFRDMCQLPEVKSISAEAPGCRKPEFIQMLSTPGSQNSSAGAGTSGRSGAVGS